ncbi:MAG: arginine--tRNA ligase [Rickettsiaceae bacterium H1]|nr:arginine--tRNA ligase [Rickettsiaceae bacterium H1]
MDIYTSIETKIFKIFGDKVPKGVTVNPSLKYGDIATNAPIIYSKIQDKSVKEVGNQFASKIKKLPEVDKIELAGAGFLNITIKNRIWQNIVRDINNQGINYGASNLGNSKVIHVESVSANPTGPLHIGHARSAIFFGALSKLLEKVGYKVVREYYINDAGSQIDALTESAFFRYKEALGHSFTKSTVYPGEYLKKIGQKLADKYENQLIEYNPINKKIIRDFTINEIMNSIKEDLGLLGIKHDVFTSEKSLHDKIEEAVGILDKKGLIYKGSLQDPKGKKKEDWSAHEHLLFKSTQFGDESDRSLQKADGNWTYFAADIAYHLDKIKRGFNNMILGLGLDHAGYVNRLKGAVEALNDDIILDIKLYDIVHLFENGKAVKMSKRSGNFLTVRELTEDIGADVVKYMMLTRRHDVVLDLDLATFKEQSQKNPIFYVQYAHARACSVLRQARNNDYNDANIELLSSKTELSLIKLLAKWPRTVKNAAVSCEPHKITTYLQEIAEAFHSLWHCGKKDTLFKFIVPEDKNLTKARSALINAVRNTIASGLNIISIKAKKSM